MSNLVNTIFIAIKNIQELLTNSGFTVSEEPDLNTVERMFQQNKLNTIYNNPLNQQLQTYFFLSSNLRESNLEDIIEEVYINNESFKNDDILFIVIKDEISSTTQESLNHKLINEWEQHRRLVIYMSLKRLQFNLLKHVLVPKHVILTREEEDEMRKEYNVKDDTQLPEISRFDPAALTIFMKPGQICRIERISKTTITSLFYRKCLNVDFKY
jgi:DNA-directed RNA polymerase subunit H (RpoH/RPB5)